MGPQFYILVILNISILTLLILCYRRLGMFMGPTPKIGDKTLIERVRGLSGLGREGTPDRVTITSPTRKMAEKKVVDEITDDYLEIG